MNILSIIKNVCSFLFSKLSFKDWIIIILVCISGIFFIGYRYYYNKSLITTVIYNTDSLEIYKNKVKEEYVSKDIYILDRDLLIKLKTELADELKKLKDNPVVIIKNNILFKVDTIYAKSDSIIKHDSIYELNWHIDEPNGFYSLTGMTTVHNDFSKFSTLINKLNLDALLTFDILDNGDNKLRLIGRSDNPYIVINNMDGVVFDPSESSVLKKFNKLKKWSIGPLLGIGITGDLRISPYIGIGVSYGFIQF